MSKKALLIGINYPGTPSQLSGCINDAKNVRTVLTTTFGYPASNIKLLTDEQGSLALPTRANIEANIAWLLLNAKAGDTLFFHYSGHGSHTRDTNGDETDGRDECLIPSDYTTRGVISDDWLFTNLLQKVPPNVTLWSFTDCCHSGTMLDLKYNYKSQCAPRSKQLPTTYVPSEWTDSFTIGIERSRDIPANCYLFSGCLDTETAADAYINRQPQGAFTACFLDFVRNNTSNGPNNTRVFNTTIKLRNMLKELNARLDIAKFPGQQSQLSLSKQSDFERTFTP